LRTRNSGFCIRGKWLRAVLNFFGMLRRRF
jgi:hypothetical protein